MDERLMVAEAADRLGITKEAVRKRIHRGTLRSDKDPDGTVRAYIPPSETASATAQEERPELVEVLRDEIAHLRRESERKDAIIMSLSQSNAELSRTIRQLEAPAEPPEASESASEGQERAETPARPEALVRRALSRCEPQRRFRYVGRLLARGGGGCSEGSEDSL